MSTGSGIKAHWGFSDYTLEGDAAHTLAVNIGNGNLVVSATDKVFPARIPAVMMRTYNSENSKVTGMLGNGWMFSFEESVKKVGDDFVYTDTTGAEYTWVWNGSTYNRPTGVFSDLTVSVGLVTITMPNGFMRVFDETGGFLKLYEDQNANKLRFTRDINDRLDSIDANFTGESGPDWVTLVDFIYKTSTDLVEYFGINSSSAPRWYCQYDGNSNLTSITDPLSPTGQKWTYEYDGTSGLLDVIKDPRWVAPANPNAEITYSSSKVTQIKDVDLRTIDFTYNTDVTNVSDRNSKVSKMAYGSTYLELTQIELPLPPVFPRVNPYTIDFVLALPRKSGHQVKVDY